MSLTAGVIGCGNIIRFHFDGLEKAGANIKWVCDLNETAARPWADKYDAKYTADYREIVADDQVDVLIVACVSSVHKQMCLDAIDAGKAVICEKTLAENASDAWEIVKRAEEKGTIFYTGYMKRFIPAVEKAKELLPSIGKITSTHARVHQCWGDLWSQVPTEGFFHTPEGGMSQVRKNYGGGILVCGGSHILDLVMMFVGRPSRVFSSVIHQPGQDYDVQATALMETANGTVLYEALASPLNKVGFLRDGWDERLEINGVNGRLEIFSCTWDHVDVKASMLVHYDNETGNVTEYRYAPVSPFARSTEFFCKNIAEGTQGSQSRLTGYEVDEMIEAMKLSSSTGQSVQINWKDA